jgi:hypothetical protein
MPANSSAASRPSTRRRHLRTVGSIEHRRLATRFESCAPEVRCRAAACPVCSRRLRTCIIGAVMAILGGIPDPIAATLIPGDQAMPTGDLQDFSPRRFGDMLRRQLRRAGAGNQISVGGIEGEYDQRHRSWQPPFHRAAPAVLKPTFGELCDRFHPRSDRVHRPVLKQPVNDVASG